MDNTHVGGSKLLQIVSKYIFLNPNAGHYLFNLHTSIWPHKSHDTQ